MTKYMWLSKALIITFSLWHMGAVGIYALPGDAKDGISTWIKQHLGGSVSPYILAMSQWQQWNLFSPDPLRRVTEYAIETSDRGAPWQELIILRPGSFPWWRHAAQFKMLGSLLEWDAKRDEIVERFLQLQCQEHQLHTGTSIRLVYRYYIVPQHTRTASVAWWWNWVPEVTASPGLTTTCKGQLPDSNF